MSKIFFIILCLFFFFYSAIIPATCYSNETDQQSLLAIKQAIIRDSQGALDSWNETIHFCSWRGILCSHRHQDRVVAINLMSRSLTGSLSPYIGNLSFLRRINIQNNSFYGHIPEGIGRLTRLQHVIFSNNSFSGDIPRNLSMCTNILELNLIDNNLTGIIFPELSSLTKLEALGLSLNQLSGTIPSFIGNLTKLEQLSLLECGLQGEIPESLVQLQSLRLLNLAMNRLTGRIASGLYNISTMIAFAVHINQLQGTLPSDIGFTLPRLRRLQISYNHLSGPIPVSLSNASLLEVITLDGNNFTGEMMIDFGRLSVLERITFVFNNLEGDLSFVSSMINCTRLERINMYGNLFNGLLPESIANLSSQLGLLSVGSNRLHGRILSDIGNLHGLTVLDFRHNSFEGPIPSTIGKINRLQILDLSGNKFTSEIPFSFGNLTLLNQLFLERNDLQGNIPQSLSNCTDLLVFDIFHNNLSGSIPREIMTLSSISISFDLSHNALTGSIPPEVGSLRNLGDLDLSHNRLSGHVPDSLSTCLRLERLHLERNSFTGEIPHGLRTLRGLQDLDLSHNNLSGSIPRFLSELDLVYLNLSYNMLQGEVPTLGVFQNESEFSAEGNSQLCGGIPQLNLVSCSSTRSGNGHSSTLLKILIPVGVGAIFIIFLVCCLYIFLYRKQARKITESSIPPLQDEFLRLSYADLLKATNGFSKENILGAGRYGTVYKGILDDRQAAVAVKVLNMSTKGASRSFMSECSALRGLRHRNLVKIMSVCSSTDFQGKDFKALVYCFKSNGNLNGWLHRKSEDETGKRQNLSMRRRLDIAVHIASALEYLHCGTDSTIVHGDLKPSNILLDENMTAHIGDFGLAKVVSSIFSTHESSSIGIKGTIGYIPPEYGMSGMVSTEGDIYSYGILLLEMFTGRRPTDDDGFMGYSNLHDFVRSSLPSQVIEVVDPIILHEHNSKMNAKIKNCVVSILEIGVTCSKELPRDRTVMSDVVNELHKIINMVE